ncbi:hypothetical protein HPB52_015858 [Rhipicephalus sanguineus]|nr:hypothetical protein HPB52_015858 [Rhipicephalus sanguineus]
MVVSTESAATDHTSAACVPAAHTPVVPATTITHAAAQAPAVLPPTVGAFRETGTLLHAPDVHPLIVPALFPCASSYSACFGDASAGRDCADCARCRFVHGFCVGGAEPCPI